MTGSIILWGHALAALLFGLIAVSQMRDATTALPRLTFVVALVMTALWALAVAGIDARDVTAPLVESLRNLAWLAFMFALLRRDRGAPGQERQSRAVAMVFAVVGVIVLGGMGLTIAGGSIEVRATQSIVGGATVLLRMMVAVSALVLVHHLHAVVAPAARGGIRLVVIALAAMWSIDFVLYAASYLAGRSPAELFAVRGAAVALLAPLFGLAVHRNGDWTLRLSRTVAWQSISLVATALYLLGMVLAASAITTVGGSHVRILQIAFVLGSTTALATLVSSPWLKAWAKVKLAKHFFHHRYDYRAEWVRFTETLGKPDEDSAPLDERIVKAVADLTDSPAGLLLVPEGAGLGIGAGWRWDRDGVPISGGDETLAAYLSHNDRIVELDAIRARTADEAESASVPLWMVDLPSAWVIVPLVHLERLAGAILLARPPVDRALDWEDFDLLRIAGRQVASYLAEARAQEALSDARRFDEFNRRFAFIMHDIKNLVSQLTLLARNAERHAANPAFRADMIATLQESAGRMNALLARLSQHHSARAEELCAVEIVPLVERVAARRRTQHPVATTGARAALAIADPARLEQVIGHLLQNAIEASPPGEPVTIAVATEGAQVMIDVIDRGSGMSPAFIRDQLFRPFVSSKPGGFGIGAFEARQLAQAMGGSVAVTSREGAGTCFRVTLGMARDAALPIGEAA